MAACVLCNASSQHISKELGVCLRCIRERSGDALPIAVKAHTRSRADFGLPERPPKDPKGIPCKICANECRIPESGMGYCGLRSNKEGRLTGVSSDEGKLSWYHDPLPTNCVGTGYVRAEQGRAIRNMPIVRGLNMDTKTSRFSFMPALSTACIVRTGISDKRP